MNTDVVILSRQVGDDLEIVGQPEESGSGRRMDKEAVKIATAHSQAITLRIKSKSRQQEEIDLFGRNNIPLHSGGLRDDPRITVEIVKSFNRRCPESGALLPPFPVRNNDFFYQNQ